MNNNSEWKPVLDFEKKYVVSNEGLVLNLHFRGTNKTRLLKLHKNKIDNDKAYYQVSLIDDNGKEIRMLVHRIVWEAFNGRIPEGMEINHINENKLDNRIENLSLVSRVENCNWGTRNERIFSKTTNGKLSTPVCQCDLNGNFIKEYPSQAQVQKDTGFSQGKISMCCTGKRKTAYGYIWKFKEGD